MRASGSVSYTHLDVYKRQLLIPLLVAILIGLAVALWFSTYYAAFDFVKKRRKMCIRDRYTGVGYLDS